MDLEYLIERLEELLDRGTRVPMTTRVIIDENEYLRLIDQMRISVPQEIRKARQIEAERDQLLAGAQSQADAMIAAARDSAEGLVAEHPVLQQAEERANEVLELAYAEAARIREDADAYALEVLQRLGAQIEGFGRTVRNGIRLLESGSPVGSPGAAAPNAELPAAEAGP